MLPKITVLANVFVLVNCVVIPNRGRQESVTYGGDSRTFGSSDLSDAGLSMEVYMSLMTGVGRENVTIGNVNFSICPFSSCKHKCFSKSTFSNASNSSKHATNVSALLSCRCDEMCVYAGDCCADYFLQCHHISDYKEIVDLAQNSFTSSAWNFPELDHLNIAHVIKLYSKCIEIGEGYFTVVTSCPTGFSNTTLKNLCLNLTSPVSYKYQPILVFKNVECAICHGVDINDTIKWTARLGCFGMRTNPTIADLITAYRNDQCSQTYSPPENARYPRTCPQPIDIYAITEVTVSDPPCPAQNCSNEDKFLCATYKLPLYTVINRSLRFNECFVYSTLFDNMHCLNCQTTLALQEFVQCCNFSCFSREIYMKFIAEGSRAVSRGIVVLFDLSNDGSGVEVNGQQVSWPGFYCLEDEVYDYVSKVCRQLVCPSGYVLLDKDCVRDDSVVSEDSQLLPKGTPVIWFHFELADHLSCQSMFCGDLNDVRKQQKERAECPYDIYAIYSILKKTFEALAFPSSLSCSEDLHLVVAMNSTSDCRLADMFNALRYIGNHALLHNDFFLNISITNKWLFSNDTPVCPNGRQPLEETELNITENNHNLYAISTRYGFQQLYPLENVIFDFTRISQTCGMESMEFVGEETKRNTAEGQTKSCDWKDKVDMYIDKALGGRTENNVVASKDHEESQAVTPMTPAVCSHHLKVLLCEQQVENSSLTCPAVIYSKNQTLLENDTLSIVGTDMVFSKDEYEILYETVLVCSRFENLNDFWKKLNFFEYNFEQLYVMHTLTAVSIFSLLTVLVVYSLLPDLRTLPGKITSCHVASLLIGHVTLITDLPSKLACRFIAALSHLVWLSAFAWTSALAIHMASTFFAPTANQKTRLESETAFRKYSLVCWGLPLIVVITSLTLDSIPSLNVKIEYGVDVCGWIGDAKAIICSFFVPVGISLLINFLALYAAIFGIERTARASRLANSRCSEGQRLLVYVKMSAAMGFTWVLGLFVAFLQWSWLLWVFVVLNSSQGTFIALAFLVNNRVLRLLRQKLVGKAPMKNVNSFTSTSEYQTEIVSVSATSTSD